MWSIIHTAGQIRMVDFNPLILMRIGGNNLLWRVFTIYNGDRFPDEGRRGEHRRELFSLTQGITVD